MHPVELKGPNLSYPSGEYSRLNTAPWVCVLRFTDSTAGFMEQYKLVIVLKLSRAGSTNTPRLIVLLCSHENRLVPRRLSVLESPPLPACGTAAGGRQHGSRSSDAGDVELRSGRSSLPLSAVVVGGGGGGGEATGAMSSSTSDTLPLSGLSCDSSASSLSLWCSELIVAAARRLQRRKKLTASGHLPSMNPRPVSRPVNAPWPPGCSCTGYRLDSGVLLSDSAASTPTRLAKTLPENYKCKFQNKSAHVYIFKGNCLVCT